MKNFARSIGNLLLRVLGAIEGWVNSKPLIVREYRYQFGNGIGVKVRLCNRYPRYRADFSEPLSSWLVETWHEERARMLAHWKAETGIEISSEAELSNECHRSL